MTVAEVQRKGETVTRAGTQALTLLAAPLNVAILRALAGGSRSLIDLRRGAGSPPQTTMRGHLRKLTEIGVLRKQRQGGFPGALDFELTAGGRDLLAAGGVLATWLAGAPDGPVQLGTGAARSTVKALVDGWATNLVRALAAKPLSLTELDRVIADVSYPSLERRLAAMRLAGQVEAVPGQSRGRPYAVTGWLRRAIAPLAAAARWEHANQLPGSAPMTRLDVEAAFLLAVPLLTPPPDMRGACRLAVEVPNGNGARLAGVVVGVDGGRVASCASRLQGPADAWASGSAGAWLRAVVEQDPGRLELGGDDGLAGGLVEGLHEALFLDARARRTS